MFRSLCIPSNRKLNLIKDNIDSTLNYINSCADIELVLTDNSNDKNKEDYLSKLKGKQFNYLISEYKGTTDNWIFSLKSSKGKFISNMGDDDKIMRLGTLNLNNIGSDVVGIRPSFIVYTNEFGVMNHSNFSIIEDSPIKRINEYFKKCNGNNNTLYSFFKKNILIELYDILQFHPFKNSGYWDWTVVLALIAEGKIISDPSTVIFYDNSNWTTNEKIQSSVTDLFVKENLNSKLANYLLLLLGFDSFILIARKHSGLGLNEKMNLALTVMNSYIDNFFRSIKLDKFDTTEINSINKLISTKDFMERFKIFFKLLNYLSPGKSEEYLFFLTESTGVELT